MGNTKYLMVLAIAAVGLFAMPGLLATYAGTHTIEDGKPKDTSGSAKAIDCTTCHGYIYGATQVSNNSKTIYTAHLSAAGEVNYTTYLRLFGTDYTTNHSTLGDKINQSANWSAYNAFFITRSTRNGASVGGLAARDKSDTHWYPVNNDTAAKIGTKTLTETYPDVAWRACLLCHQAPAGTHTRLEIKGCTNAYCHGSAGQESLATATVLNKSKTAANVGPNLGKAADAHSTWFNRSGKVADEHTNTGSLGSTNTKDYYTCLGCHTHTDVDLKITKPTGFNATLNATTIGYVISDNTTELTSTKYGGAFKN